LQLLEYTADSTAYFANGIKYLLQIVIVSDNITNVAAIKR